MTQNDGHYAQVNAEYCSDYHFWQEAGALFIVFIHGESSPQTWDYEMWHQETREVTLLYGVKCFSHKSPVWQTYSETFQHLESWIASMVWQTYRTAIAIVSSDDVCALKIKMQSTWLWQKQQYTASHTAVACFWVQQSHCAPDSPLKTVQFSFPSKHCQSL